MSKSIKIELFAGNTQITKELTINSNVGMNKVIGTCIQSIFQFNDRLKKHGSDYIKANQEISLILSSEESVLLDSYVLNSEYGTKLKFGGSAKSKRKFATFLNDLITWAAEDITLVTLDELINSLTEDKEV